MKAIAAGKILLGREIVLVTNADLGSCRDKAKIPPPSV